MLLAPASAMAQEAIFPNQLSEAEAAAIAAASAQQVLPLGTAIAESHLTGQSANLYEALPEDLGGTLAASEVVAAVAEADDSAWVTDSLKLLDQMVATQASLPASGAQADAVGLLPSSANSSDLQPVESPSASEDLFQTPLAQTSNLAQTPPTQSQAERWHFSFVPYVYVPLFISGSATYKGTENFQNNFSRNIDASGNLDNSRNFEFVPSQITTALENSLNFAFLGALEAWTPNYTLGFLANVDYLSLSSSDTFTRAVRRPGFADFIPTELNSSSNVQLWNVDLAAGYRFYDAAKVNPESLDTEFDLGPFVFDVLGGLNVSILNSQLGLNTNLGGSGESVRGNTIVSPLLGGRFRWNATPRLAVLASGTVSGFGIGGLMKYGLLGGVDWMFSGNTSLGLGYRVGFLDYSSSEVDLDVNQNGPYLNFGFRF